MLGVTFWESLTDIHEPNPETYHDLAALYRHELTRHLETADKFSASGFGPYVLTDAECVKHETSEPHRCDRCVQAITMAVFDVDQGGQDDVTACDERLDGIERVWYTSYSYREDKPALRLILSLSRPVPPLEWQAFRLMLLENYRIPADRSACSGLSHFYFLPACPPGADRFSEYVPGRPIPVDSYPRIVRNIALTAEDWDEDEEPTGPVDMEKVRAAAKARAATLGRKGQEEKAAWLRRALDGKALDQQGRRNTAMSTTCGILVYLCPDVPISALYALVLASLRAMQSEGSKLSGEDVQRMLRSSRANQRAAAERLADFEQAWRGGLK